MSPSKDFEKIASSIRKWKSDNDKAAADSEALNMKDPADKGEKEIPSHPDGDSKKKTMVPDQQAENKSREGQDVTDKDTKPSSTGENVPGPVEDGNAKDDAATSPDTPLAKIANKVPGLMERIQKLNTTKEASEASAGEGKKAEGEGKKAGEQDATLQNMQFTDAFHLKLASIILSTEEGINFAEKLVEKEAGLEAAADLMKSAGEQQYLMSKEAAEYAQWAEYVEQYAAQCEDQFNDLTKSASEEDMQEIIKLAQSHEAISNKFEHDFEKQAYDVGAADAAGMEDAMAGGEEVPGEAQLNPEDILALLDQAVQSGELDEETAMMLAEQLLGGEMGGMDGGEEMPPEAMAAEKMASEVLSV